MTDGPHRTPGAELTDPPRATAIGGPTLLLEFGGLRLLTDPTFSAPGEYESAPGRFLSKLAGPAVPVERVGPLDAVLLSHDQHVDNLDPAGRDLINRVPVVLTTPIAAQRLGGSARGLAPWESVALPRPDGATLRVTAVPALHGPDGSEPMVGPVTGFVLTASGLPTVYLSGDNASLRIVRSIAEQFPSVDAAVLFAGAAKSPKLLGDALLTFGAAGTAEAAIILGAPVVVPVHYEGWGHFTEGVEELRHEFDRLGIGERLRVLPPGEPTDLLGARTGATGTPT